jgi:SRSO17 transposase
LIGKRFLRFIKGYGRHFVFDEEDAPTQAKNYLCGLMQAKKKNMERMAEVVPESDEQALQHFLANSFWDEQAVMDQVARDANRHLGGHPGSALLIDEAGITKKGNKSVGVSRQWNGRLGKVDNCQVGVFVALSLGTRVTLVDRRLYLPQAWVEDPKRCDEVKIPKRHRELKSKATLALEMVRRQRSLGVQFAWVGGDAGYGKNPALLRALEDDGEIFVMDVHRDQRVYLEDPRPQWVERQDAKGRVSRRLQAQEPAIKVEDWKKAQPPSAWTRVTLRESTKGQKRVETLHRQVWLWDGREERARHWHLIVRREIDSPKEIKYTFSNAPAETTPQRLAQMQGQRFWIERQFEDAKGEVGLDHYQTRGWVAWHRHMTLVSMAMLFMLQERLLQQEAYPLLSCADIECLLARFLPRRDRDPEELIRQMELRHRKRQRSIDSAYRQQWRTDSAASTG